MAILVATSAEQFLRQVAQDESGPLIHEQELAVDCVSGSEVHGLQQNVLLEGRWISEVRKSAADGHEAAHVVNVAFGLAFFGNVHFARDP